MWEILKECNFIFDRLEKSGFECYAVGGCVRDMLLGVTPNDIDFTTNATPDEILHCFSDFRTFELGKKFGTISVMNNENIYEITTYRIDGKYNDSRHPENVEFSRNLKDDLARRDFTVNAMAMDRNGNIIDIYGGREDLNNKTVRAVGNAEERFTEDALRIFRALRFSCKLNFKIEKTTSLAAKKLSTNLSNVHPQRLRDELRALLLTDSAPEIIKEYKEIFFTILPELKECDNFKQITAHHRYDVLTHILKTLKFAPKNEEIRFALLFHDIAKPKCHTTDKAGISHFNGHPAESAYIAAEILKRFSFPSDFIKKVSLLIKYHDVRFEKPRLHIKRLLSKLDVDDLRSLLVIQRCDILAQSEYLRTEKLKHIDFIEAELNAVIDERACFKLKDLAVNGNDIINLGISGKEIGNILDALLNLVIEEKLINNKSELLNYAKEYLVNIDK